MCSKGKPSTSEAPGDINAAVAAARLKTRFSQSHLHVSDPVGDDKPTTECEARAAVELHNRVFSISFTYQEVGGTTGVVLVQKRNRNKPTDELRMLGTDTEKNSRRKRRLALVLRQQWLESGGFIMRWIQENHAQALGSLCVCRDRHSTSN